MCVYTEESFSFEIPSNFLPPTPISSNLESQLKYFNYHNMKYNLLFNMYAITLRRLNLEEASSKASIVK